MLRSITVGLVAVAGVLGWNGSSHGQVTVRAPFVRVDVGGPAGSGVAVHAPFVNLWIPTRAHTRAVRCAPPPLPEPTVTRVRRELPQTEEAEETTLTLAQFAGSFQAEPGSHKVTVVNPVTNSPTSLSFTLPQGKPRRVAVNKHRLTFVYDARHWVRIKFDRDGATVTSR